MRKELTWGNVLHGGHLLKFGHIDNFYERVVRYTGYPYFLWDDVVYKVENRRYKETHYTRQDVR